MKSLGKQLFLTVITVVKNDENNIEKTIKSIISNNSVKLEYIIIDEASMIKHCLLLINLI